MHMYIYVYDTLMENGWRAGWLAGWMDEDEKAGRHWLCFAVAIITLYYIILYYIILYYIIFCYYI